MPSFSCQRCKQSIHLPASLSDDAVMGGALTQSAYDVIQAESVLVRRPKAAAPSELAPTKESDEVRLTKTEEDRERDPQHEQGTLSSRVAITTSLFDLLSSTVPGPLQSSSSSDSPASSDSSSPRHSRRHNHVQKQALLPLGSASGETAALAAIDHPLCKECTDILVDIINSQLGELRRERDAYLAFEDEINNAPRRSLSNSREEQQQQQQQQGEADEESRGAEEDTQAIRSEIERLAHVADETRRELSRAEEERRKVDAELSQLDEEERKLEEEERAFWLSYSDLTLQMNSVATQRASLETTLEHDMALLKRLQRTNVYKDAFCIGHEAGFATINGLRLGRLPSPAKPVEWAEINAAWGQTALCLSTLARKCNFTFQDYKICPKGSFSTVEKVSAQGNTSSGATNNTAAAEVYELYGSDSAMTRFLQLHSRRFDHAMVAFLDCVRQLADHVAATSARAGTGDGSEFRLAHEINKDKIGGASIRLHFGASDEVWTRALRHLLLNLSLLLNWITGKDDDDVDEGRERV